MLTAWVTAGLLRGPGEARRWLGVLALVTTVAAATGLLQWRPVPEAFKKRIGHVHNTPLQILVERGLIGLAAWLWIWVAFYARAGAILRRLPPGHEAERGLVVGCLAAVTGFLVAGLAEYNFGDSEVVRVLWAIMALPFTVERTGAGTERRASSAGRDPSPSEPSRSTV